jgi:hypothetical protein
MSGRESLGEFEHQVLLAILRLGGEAYSVPIVLEIEERTGRDVAPAAVYIALHRLQDKRRGDARFCRILAQSKVLVLPGATVERPGTFRVTSRRRMTSSSERSQHSKPRSARHDPPGSS